MEEVEKVSRRYPKDIFTPFCKISAPSIVKHLEAFGCWQHKMSPVQIWSSFDKAKRCCKKCSSIKGNLKSWRISDLWFWKFFFWRKTESIKLQKFEPNYLDGLVVSVLAFSSKVLSLNASWSDVKTVWKMSTWDNLSKVHLSVFCC